MFTTTTTTSTTTTTIITHIALLPSAGMGHLTPFLRLATILSSRGLLVSLVTTHPTVSASEAHHISTFLTSFPQIRSLPLNLPTIPHPSPSQDPFFLRFETIRQCSPGLLPPLLASTPPFTAFVTDITLLSTTLPIVSGAGLPCYALFTSSATMLSFCAYFDNYLSSLESILGDVDIPGIKKIPRRSILLPLYNPSHIFTSQFIQNGLALSKCEGILVNTFDALEPDALAALNEGKVVPNFPPVFAIGPLEPFPSFPSSSPIPWLDDQPENSVIYVSFGSRTAMPPSQIKQLALGLESSNCRFLWVLKSTVVDRDDETTALDELLGKNYEDRVKGRGLVMRKWVEQQDVLKHPSVGLFLSHCGWNSVTEAAMSGRRILAWPRLEDQRVNAEVVRGSGMGEWAEEWSWEGEGEVVEGVEIARRLREAMADGRLEESAARIGGKARKAVGAGGSSDVAFGKFEKRLGRNVSV